MSDASTASSVAASKLIGTSAVFPNIGPDLNEAIRRMSQRKVVLQVPAGLVRDAHVLARQLEEATERRVVVLARACFGACDLPTPDEAPGAELAVVLGHAPIPNIPLPLPTLFVEMRDPAGDPEKIAEAVTSARVPRRLGIVASVQHLDLIPGLVDSLRRRGYEAVTGEGDRRLGHPSQALGCNYTGAEAIAGSVDAFLFVGTGRFHPIGLAYAVGQPVWAFDPRQNVLTPPVDRTSLIAVRLLRIAQARDARNWGILVSSFVGQDRTPTALALQRRAREKGREAEILVFGRLEPGDLEGRSLDAYVNTACPRIALDDSDLYPKPVLTPPEFLMAIGDLPLDRYVFDTFH